MSEQAEPTFHLSTIEIVALAKVIKNFTVHLGDDGAKMADLEIVKGMFNRLEAMERAALTEYAFAPVPLAASNLFRRKPTEVNAYRFGIDAVPDWYLELVADAHIIACPDCVYIITADGWLYCGVGDWIIRHSTGRLWRCESEMFHLLYERPES